MKRSFGLLISFCLGLFISFSIIACADDFTNNELQAIREMIQNIASKVEVLEDKVAIFENSNYNNSINQREAWCNSNFEYHKSYNEKGELSGESTYTYNSKGWLEKIHTTSYIEGRKYITNISSYTYSELGDERYCTIITTLYDETGKDINTQTTRQTEKLRQ